MIIWLLKWILCSGSFLGAYLLLLEKEKAHRFKRFYLLLSMAASFIIPLIRLKEEWVTSPVAESIMPPVQLLTSQGITPAAAETISYATPAPVQSLWPAILITAYVVVSFVLCIRLVKHLAALTSKIKCGDIIEYGNNKLVLITAPVLPHSFLHYIFLNKTAYESGQVETEVLLHEAVHASQKHTIDVLLTEVLLVFCWANPFLWLYRKAIALNHEFLADDGVTRQGFDVRSYSLLLLQKADGQRKMLISSFQYAITKKRLLMMTGNTSRVMALVKQVALLPLMAAAVFIFSTKVSGQQKQEPPVVQQFTAKPPATDSGQLDAWFLKQSIGWTEAGVSEELMEEYETTAAKYKTNEKKETNIWSAAPQDRDRMETIFRQMSRQQQLTQHIRFVKPAGPLPRAVPTPAQLEAFKKATIYGVWINDRKISNDALNQYKNTDFSQVFVSKLYGAAKKGRSYTHQVNLMTNAAYNKYYKETVNNRKAGMAYFTTFAKQ